MAQRAMKIAQELPAKVPGIISSVKKSGQSLIVAAKPAVQKASTLAIKELGPPSMAQWPAIRSDLQGLVKDAQKMAFLNVTVGEAVTGLLIGVEVACWFYVGEIIGRRSLVGYNV